jgi:uncharacterized protein
MRLVLDTNIVVSGLLWQGAPARLIDDAIAGEAELCSSARLIGELGRTLGKPAIFKRLAQRNLAARTVLARYRDLCGMFEPGELQSIAPDPDDDWVIATALAARADLIVTGDKALLGVGNVGALRIVGVTEALELIGSD